MTCLEKLKDSAARLRDSAGKLRFQPPVDTVYNPLEYAWSVHAEYLERYGEPVKRVIFLGMNPGPWGMAQTGVPFGEISIVRDWLNLEGRINKPEVEHPKRPVSGFMCQRSEVSGSRLWGLFRERYQSPQDFFCCHFVANYCPLSFMEESGRNRTPEKLPVDERRELFSYCDRHFLDTVEILRPEWVIGVGRFARECAARVLTGRRIRIAGILHPSPANPAANRDWSGFAVRKMVELGIWSSVSGPVPRGENQV